MQKNSRLRRLCVGWLVILTFAVLAIARPAEATSANTDLTDIWWNPAESGWGMQMVNTGTFVFATLYVYGTNGQPTWATAELRKTSADLTTYSGPLYLSTGPYFGGPFNPNAVAGRPAGTMTFVLSTVSVGQLTYSVDGVVVVKAVQRQPLTFDNYNGSYLVTVTQTSESCLNPANNGTVTANRTLNITQSGSSMVAVSNGNGVTCTTSGTFTQLGRMGRLQGNYSCTTGEIGTAVILEMSNVPYMFTARLQSQSSNLGCVTEGEVAGLIPR